MPRNIAVLSVIILLSISPLAYAQDKTPGTGKDKRTAPAGGDEQSIFDEYDSRSAKEDAKKSKGWYPFVDNKKWYPFVGQSPKLSEGQESGE